MPARLIYIGSVLGLVLFGLNASAQEYTRKQGFSLLLEAGLDNSSILDGGQSTGSSLTIPYGGAGLESPGLVPGSDTAFPRQITFSFSTLFAGRGAAYNDPAFKQRFFYADFPLRIKTPVLRGMEGFLGIKPSYLINVSRNNDNVQFDSIPIKNPSDFTLSFGGGISFAVSSKIDLGVSYWHNLNGLTEDFKHSWVTLGIQLNIQETYEDLASGPSKADSQRLAMARHHVKALKNGALLVRLPSKRNTLRSLREKGKYWEAARVAEQNRYDNRKIREAFAEQYNFSEVYYFYDTSTKAVRNKEFRGHLFDAKDRPAWNPDIDTFYIADLGDTYLESEKGLFNGLVIMDQSLNPLEKPFPNKIEGHGSLQPLDLDRSPAILIDKFRNALWRFYNEQFGAEGY